MVGARLLRKLLVAYTRWNSWDVQALPTQEELNGLLAEARRLAEAADDEDERWQVRLAGIRLLVWDGNSTVQEAEKERAVALTTAAHFEKRNDRAAFSAALNGYTVLSYRIGADHDALEASRRRLSTPDLPLIERADAVQLMAATLLNLDKLMIVEAAKSSNLVLNFALKRRLLRQHYGLRGGKELSKVA
ncbi:MAG: hypothetical protein NVS4B11_31970 [Ktedonobacteraceae bacterium]